VFLGIGQSTACAASKFISYIQIIRLLSLTTETNIQHGGTVIKHKNSTISSRVLRLIAADAAGMPGSLNPLKRFDEERGWL